MSDWAEIRELTSHATERFSTFRAEGRSIQDRIAARRAVESRRPPSGHTKRVFQKAGTASAVGSREQEWRMWRGGPLLVRSEYYIGKELITVVAQGPRWWRWSRTLGATSGGGPGHPVRFMLGPPGVLADPAPILDNVEPTKIAIAKFLGREAFVISARPTADRPRARMALREAGTGADEYELVIDVERGVLLSITANHSGEPFRSTITGEVGFDEAFSPQLFSLDTPGEAQAVISRPVRRSTLAELPGTVEFPVYAPEPRPSPVDPHVAVFESDRRGLGPHRVVLTYVVAEENRRGQLRVTCAPTALPRGAESWQRREEFELHTERLDRFLRSRVRKQIGTVSVELESTVLGTERLIELAKTLTVLTPSP